MKSKHFKDENMLRQLGRHCRTYREQRGFSIDRLSKESDGLSTSVIQRLEQGTGPVTVSSLFRYAKALEIDPKILIDYKSRTAAESTVVHESGERRIEIIESDSPLARREAFLTYLPLTTVEASAGSFGDSSSVEVLGWIKVDLKNIDTQMFVIRAKGHSMSPLINDGDFLVMRSNPSGSKQGKIVLAEHRSIEDPDTGGSYAIKRYTSEKVIDQSGLRHLEVVLQSTNPEYENIRIEAGGTKDIRILAELIQRLG